ncbi:RICIN domain-containing protein, partial [Streptomyces sp. NPDC090052]|uniref:RICIN domain-containing protein n=1 Tax=Streptomyces sp. NPDC090052 TaxID=3365931 RepID=UPI0037F2C113
FTHKPTVATRATAKVAQAGDIPAPTPTQSLPTPAASVPPPPTPSAPNPDAGNSGGGSGGGGGGGGAPKKKPDPANAKHVLIKNDGTKLCAELPGRDKGQINGWVIENDCNPTDADNQIWDLEVRYPHGGPHNNSLFQMRNIKDRLCMDLGEMGPRPAGTGLAEFTCDGTKADNQLWWLDKQRDDHYLIRNYASNDLCLKTTQNGPDNQQGTNDDNELMIGQCDIQDAHEWSFIQIPKDS